MVYKLAMKFKAFLIKFVEDWTSKRFSSIDDGSYLVEAEALIDELVKSSVFSDLFEQFLVTKHKDADVNEDSNMIDFYFEKSC